MSERDRKREQDKFTSQRQQERWGVWMAGVFVATVVVTLVVKAFGW